MDRLKNLERLFSEILQEKNDYYANGGGFNILSVINRVTDEVCHSAFLAELLKPYGSHGAGPLFIKLFLDTIGVIVNADLINANVITEKFCYDPEQKTKKQSFHGRRIDILISFGSEECILIENKIYATDQKAQMLDYYLWAKTQGFKSIQMVYLSPEGKSPTKSSIEREQNGILEKIPIRINNVSYRNDIISFISMAKEHLVEQSSRMELMLDEYESTINRFLGMTDERLRKGIKKLLNDNDFGFGEILPELEQAILDYKTDVHLRFWKRIYNLLKAKDSDGLLIETKPAPTESQIREYYVKGKSKRIAREWKIKDSRIKLKLQIHNNFAYGISPLKVAHTMDNEFLIDKLKERFEINRDPKHWFAYKYPEPVSPLLDFRNCSKFAISVVENKMIEPIVTEIMEFVTSLNHK